MSDKKDLEVERAHNERMSEERLAELEAIMYKERSELSEAVLTALKNVHEYAPPMTFSEQVLFLVRAHSEALKNVSTLASKCDLARQAELAHFNAQLANEAELHRADTLIGELRAKAAQWDAVLATEGADEGRRPNREGERLFAVYDKALDEAEATDDADHGIEAELDATRTALKDLMRVVQPIMDWGSAGQGGGRSGGDGDPRYAHVAEALAKALALLEGT